MARGKRGRNIQARVEGGEGGHREGERGEKRREEYSRAAWVEGEEEGRRGGGGIQA